MLFSHQLEMFFLEFTPRLICMDSFWQTEKKSVQYYFNNDIFHFVIRQNTTCTLLLLLILIDEIECIKKTLAETLPNEFWDKNASLKIVRLSSN